MGLRDLILLAALLGIIPMIVRAPIVGLLAWIWVAIMYPQREVYGALGAFQINLAVAAVTACAWAASKDRKVLPHNPTIAVMGVFAVWVCFTTYTAMDSGFSAIMLDRTLKGMLLALLAIIILSTKARIQAAVWVLVISLAYYGVKGGGFTLLAGGSSRVFGPENTQIGDNNLLGLALVTVLPLMNYLRVSTRERWVSYACMAVMALTLVAIVGTYSRGAFLALTVVAAFYVLRSRGGIVPLILGAILVAALPALMPEDWFARMATIQSADEDASFGNRLQAWTTTMNVVAAHPIAGAGFSAIELDWVAAAYQSPGSLDRGRAAHSIYMQVLGDHGYVGLALYLLLMATAWLNTFNILRLVRGNPDMEWAAALTRMLQLSLIAFGVGGAALSMAYYDGYLLLLAFSVAILRVVKEAQAPAPSPVATQAVSVA